MPLIAIAQNRRMSDYLESIRRAGGEPVEVVPGAETPEQILARVDGLMLTGGGDVDPALYGEVAERHVPGRGRRPRRVRDRAVARRGRRAAFRSSRSAAACRC